MANVTSFPFELNETIETYADFIKLAVVFYTDTEGTTPVDYTGSTFEGQFLDYPGGNKLFDATFYMPNIGGIVWPQLTKAQATTLVNYRTIHYYVKVITDGLEEAYFSGTLTVSNNFQPGV